MIELYPHNQSAYESVLNQWKTTNRTCIVHATGTGKSLIIAKIIQENPKTKCLFLAPNVFILNQIKKHLKKRYSNVHFNTYQYFVRNDVDAFKNYSYIFLDEFHRIGAPEWNKNIVDILNNNPQAKILGTTATHVRYLDDNRDMAEELFNSNISSYIDLGTAIEKKIHQKPKYVSAIYNISEIIDNTIVKLRKYKKDKEIEKLQSKRIVWEQSKGIDFIINKYLDLDRKKILIFCKSKEHLEEIEKLINPILTKFYNGNVEFHKIFHLIGQSKNIKTLNYFEKAEIPQVIFSIDMLNEGIHVNGVDTIMMFRDTISPIIYFQQLGRVFLSGQETEPLIFDFVNNFNIKNSVNNLNSEFYNDFNQKNTNDYFVKEKNLIIDYYDEILDFYNFIEEFKINTWEESYQQLKQFVKENNRLPKHNESYWLNSQKKSYKKGRLSEEQIQLLLKLDPNFLIVRKIPTWEESYQELKKFVEENDRLPKYNEFRWLYFQRQYCKNGNLTQEQIQLLLKLDPDFLKIKKIPTWEESYQELKQFVKENNRLPKYNESNWLNSQKKSYKKGRLSEEQIQLLIKLVPDFLKVNKKLSWKENYQELKQFVEENDRLPKYNESNWLNSQRQYYKKGKLSEEQIQLLIKLVPNIFESKILSWEESYQELKQFVEENDRLPKYKESNWLNSQRQYYKKRKLSEEQIQLLIKLVPDFLKVNKKLSWKESYQELKQFVKENNRLPKYNESNWLNSQKKYYKKEKLSEEQIQLLLKLDPDFLKVNKKLSWEENYQELKQFVEENDRLPKYNESYWLSLQKNYYKKEKLSEEQIQLLLKLDPNIFESKISSWKENYQELKQFVKENNRLPKYNESNWLNSQKKSYKKGKLSEEQIQLLIKLVPNIFESKLSTWEESYQELKQFVEENNRLPKHNESNWLNTQRQYYKKGKLSEEQIQLLLKLDPNIFESKKLSWEESYQELKQFVEENNRLPKYNESYWLFLQKNYYKKGRLSEEQIQLLLKLDPDLFE